MALQIHSLDNISDTVLDYIKRKFTDKGYTISDEREKLSFGKAREYFLFSNRNKRDETEWTFIWIGNNLWQFSYLNTNCKSKASWVNPLELLNELLKN
tara:strand:- start:6248 stop:6541 length:294 start_codon:yes stop_codon:yes gene_type:complete